MHIKIYINNKPLYLCNELDTELNLLTHQPDIVFIDELDHHTVKTMLSEMHRAEVKAGIFLSHDLEKLKTEVLRKFEVLPAGGGVVQNEHGGILMIFRRGFWDLPKGKLEKGESLEECALREVTEETSLKTLQLQKKLTVTYHAYEMGTHQMLKESHWFAMRGTSSEEIIPQTEEDISEIKWVKREDLPSYEKMTYPSILDVLALVK